MALLSSRPNTLFFLATDGLSGLSLWASEIASGSQVALFQAGVGYSGDSVLSGLIQIGESLFFTVATSDLASPTLWVSDGTIEGTHQVAELCTDLLALPPPALRLPEDRLYYGSRLANNSCRFLSTDGTEAGTIQLAEFSNTSPYGGAPLEAVATPKEVYFSFDDSERGIELWAVVPGSNAPRLVTDLNRPGGDSSPRDLSPFDGRLLFSVCSTHQEFVWMTDGTATGTQPIPNAPPVGEGCHGFNQPRIVSLGDVGIFLNADFSQDGQIWRTDGTPGGTFSLGDIPYYPSLGGLVSAQNLAFFTRESEVWRTDGTVAGTFMVKDLGTDFVIEFGLIKSAKDELWFLVRGRYQGEQVWMSDGTSAGTHPVTDFPESSTPSLFSLFAVLGDDVYFFVRDDNGDTKLWVAQLPASFSFWERTSLVVLENHLYFFGGAASNGEGFVALYRSDGTDVGTHVVALLGALPPSITSRPTLMTVLDNQLYFVIDDEDHGRELWASDGSEAGTRLVAERPVLASSSPPTTAPTASSRGPAMAPPPARGCSKI